MEEDFEPLEPHLKELVNSETLQWIFVGGKGGVGKTTTSCCLGTLLSKVRKSVLLVSTDPAHNLSDAFNQKFSRTPTLVNGYSNLYCMEIDPAASMEEAAATADNEGGSDSGFGLSSLFKNMNKVLPGIDELMGFTEIMKTLDSLEFSVIVFDTAPTGHTLRLLNYPDAMESALSGFGSLKDKFAGLMPAVSSMFGGAELPFDKITEKFNSFKDTVEKVKQRFKDADRTTFVCVCIPEFLSLFETERLVQELTKFEINTENIVVNQVLVTDKNTSCDMCQARMALQKKYLDQIDDLYEDFHVVKTPLQKQEVRGKESLEAFAKFYIGEGTLESTSKTAGGGGGGGN